MEIIFLLFDAKKAVNPNHAKSIQICDRKTISTPTNAHIIIASEINLNPIVIHHMMKNGFNALNTIPVIIGPCFGFFRMFFFFPTIVLICSAANPKSVSAPKIDMIVLNSGKISKENTPIPNKITNGSSTIVCPIAILIPDLTPSLKPYVIFAVNSGPGDITPDAEIIITKTANSIIWIIIFS